MRLLTVHPGADVSTSDVYAGMVPALQARGAQCVPYALNVRIERSASWLQWNWRKSGRPPGQRPTEGDTIYLASIGIIERALRLQPDWVLVFSGMYLHPDVLIMARRAGVRVAIILSESPYDAIAEERILPFVDLAWTNERSCVEAYRRISPNTHYLPHAFDPITHRPVDADDEGVPAHDVVFVGTGFRERIEILEAVDWTGIDLGLYGVWGLLPSRHRLRQYVRGGIVDNARAAALYRRAKVGLNLYRSSIGFGKDAPRIQHAESMNPRALELAACGVFQVSDYRDEQREIFGSLVPTFTSPPELQDIIGHYMAHPERRVSKAAAALEAVQPHTFSARAEQVLDQLVLATRSLALSA